MKPATDQPSTAQQACRPCPLPTAKQLIENVPLTGADQDFVNATRLQLQAILAQQDPRFLIIVGPCSIHDTAAGLAYAQKLAALAAHVADKLFIIMRAYSEKPRSESDGWQGLLTDPHLDGSFDILTGLSLTRKFYRSLIQLKVPIATEVLDLLLQPYLADLICWGAIGARTVEAQVYRKYASSTPFPIGFKNTTEGSIIKAIQAIQFARSSQPLVALEASGQLSCTLTAGNPHTHLILRGSSRGTNYDELSVQAAQKFLLRHHLPPTLVVDCTHGNSQKKALNQADIFRVVLKQRLKGNRNLIGCMIESHLYEGAQKLILPPSQLAYGVSITDSCISWDTTEALVLEAHASL